MTGQEAIAYIHARSWQNHAPGLARIRALLHALGDPQRDLKFLHVAGTNGKGSTCACLAAVLQAAGYRVGLNTSPYLVTFHERVRVDGVLISDTELGALTEQVRAAAETLEEEPTEFELITAIALLHFRAKGCDIAILEVGMGGALDASNVIEAPEAAVIAAMGLDHTAQLGPTLADVAAAKAGIIKAGCPVVSMGGCPEADAVIRAVAREKTAPLTEVDFTRLQLRGVGLEGADFDFLPLKGLHIPLAGAYQPRNAALALTVLEVLAGKGWHIPEEAIRRGLAEVSWPGRFQVLGRGPVVLADGAHNPQGLDAAAESLRTMLPGRKITFLVGAMADKDTSHLAEQLAPLAAAFFTVRPDNPRSMTAEELAERLRPAGVPVTACTAVAEGLQRARSAAGRDGAVCCLGSLYLVGEVLALTAET